jgi:hypothetical protein
MSRCDEARRNHQIMTSSPDGRSLTRPAAGDRNGPRGIDTADFLECLISLFE